MKEHQTLLDTSKRLVKELEALAARAEELLNQHVEVMKSIKARHKQ